MVLKEDGIQHELLMSVNSKSLGQEAYNSLPALAIVPVLIVPTRVSMSLALASGFIGLRGSC
jgi:hypothetical protein